MGKVKAANQNSLLLRANRWAPALVISTCLVAFANSMAGHTWSLVGVWLDGQVFAAASQNKSSRQRHKRSKKAQYSAATAVANINLFGRQAVAAASNNAGKGAATEVKDTSLPLALVGILLGASDSESRAFIATKKGSRLDKEKPYHVGDDLPGQAVVVEIMARAVMIQRGNKVEKLTFEKRGAKKKARPTSKRRTSVAKKSSSKGGASSSGGLTYQQIMRGQLPKSAEAYQQITNETLEQFGLAEEDGSLKVGDEANPVLSSVGLKPGDAVQTVNGVSISELRGDAAKIQEIINSGSAKIQIERDGRQFSVTYNLP